MGLVKVQISRRHPERSRRRQTDVQVSVRTKFKNNITYVKCNHIIHINMHLHSVSLENNI
jgi:hypothetical protein